MYDEYFEEADPVRRKQILDNLTAFPGPEREPASDRQDPAPDKASPMPDETSPVPDEAQLAQLHLLFSARYEPNRKGGYNDRFIGALMTFLDIIHNPGGKIRGKQNARLTAEAVHTLCLDRQDEFSGDLLYRELCHLISLYIQICGEDSQYQSVFLSMGRMNSRNLTEKIRKDLQLLPEPIHTYLGEKDDYLLFQEAIEDTMSRRLAPRNIF